jgi:hypothetical protein|tara:strand:+ start:887 stop:1051 length:165 start_codon:yes stop_codon:yes gene_type:complete
MRRWLRQVKNIKREEVMEVVERDITEREVVRLVRIRYSSGMQSIRLTWLNRYRN